MSTAFVLSGGGSLGAVQVGMLQALAERKVIPDLLVGTSAGAVNAAFVAGRGMGQAALNELAEIWTGLRRRDIFPLRPLRQLIVNADARDALCSDRGLARLITTYLHYDQLQQAGIPVHLVTTNLLSGAEVLLSDGDAASAVLASAAIPGVFAPVRRDGLILVDGGLADNAAISQAVALGADRVFVLPTGYACALTAPPSHALGVALQALGLLIAQRLIHDVALYADRVELIVLPPLCPLAISPIDFSHARQLIERARSTAGSWLDGDTPAPSHPELLLSLHDHNRMSQAGQSTGG
ncbi:MAG TPA: patatin-like phospholipase family protein [Mycobacteriales bacterium]